MSLFRVREAGFDWITATCSEWSVDYDVLRQAGHTLLDQAARDGGRISAARREGYEGWSCGSVFVGQRWDGVMVTVSGGGADTALARFPVFFLHATRLDVQVTLDVGIARETEILRAMNAASAENESRPRNKQFKISQYGRAGHTETVYICARTAQQYACIYDKEVQSKDEYYEGCVRYEVRFRGQIASKVGASLFDSLLQPSYQAAGIVKEWLSRKGVSLACEVVAPTFELPRITPPDADDARTLRWLHSQVRPSVRSLMERVSRDTLLYVIGLADTNEGDEVLPDLAERDE